MNTVGVNGESAFHCRNVESWILATASLMLFVVDNGGKRQRRKQLYRRVAPPSLTWREDAAHRVVPRLPLKNASRQDMVGERVPLTLWGQGWTHRDHTHAHTHTHTHPLLYYFCLKVPRNTSQLETPNSFAFLFDFNVFYGGANFQI